MKYRVKIKNPVIGVPITWLDKYNPDQFEMFGHEHDINGNGGDGIKEGQFEVNGKGTYKRILIRWKPEAMPTIDEDGVILYG